ncbi:DUF2637 domain-containing protein [Streptomyces sp. NPDC059853]|uniref:DUF2637 domain-containing protein n=1 Tax=Streptomyces sp. NPDC059853 TaxID=3346973 RepID=UPI003661B3F8
MIGLGIASVVGAVAIGAIGFYLSFGNLSTAGHEVFGFPEKDARFFAAGVDAAILTCLLLDLFMAALRTGWPLLRVLAHGMTIASVYFNAAAHGGVMEHPDKALAHGLMPVLFVIGVEAGRRILVQQAALPADHDVIPGHRWLLAPRATWRIYRAMRLYNRGYAQEMEESRERAIFDAWMSFKAELAKKGVQEGSEEALAQLPAKLRKHGLTVDEALALPDRMARKDLERQQEAQERARQLQRDAERAKHEAKKQALADRREMVDLEADLAEAEGVAGARTRGTVAEAEAQADARARAAAAVREVVESAEALEAKARAAEADRRAAEAQRRALESANESARLKADTEAKRAAAEEDRARALEADRRAAEAEAGVAEAEARVAEARRQAAEAIRRAVEAEDAAELTPRQRRVRIVARMVLAASPEDVPLDAIEQRLGVSTSTASGTKADAIALIEAGYDPAAGIDPEAPSQQQQ